MWRRDRAWQAAEAAGAKVAKARREMAREAAGEQQTQWRPLRQRGGIGRRRQIPPPAPEVVAAPPDTGSTAPAVDEASTAAGAADVAAERTHHMTAAAYYAKLLQASEVFLDPGMHCFSSSKTLAPRVDSLESVRSENISACLLEIVLAQTKQCVPPTWPRPCPLPRPSVQQELDRRSSARVCRPAPP